MITKRGLKKCAYCNKEFLTYFSANHKYCSRYCCDQAKTGEKNDRWRTVILICQVCGNKYFKRRYAVAESKYCSRKCKHIAWSKRMKGKKLPEKWRNNISRRLKEINFIRGETNPNWKGGISPYNQEFLRGQIQPSIKARDAYRCRLCGEQKESRYLTVHHIDENTKNDDQKNLLTLCYSCHYKIHNTKTGKEKTTCRSIQQL